MTSANLSIPYQGNTPPSSHQESLTTRLLGLYAYAYTHPHSRQWCDAILTILVRLEVPRG
jgi:hypothetical protein